MSGGFFRGSRWAIGDVRQDIERLVETNEKPNGWGEVRNYSPAILNKFREAIAALLRAEVMTERIDYLVSGDDGENDFHKRWTQELQALERGAQ
jgi:hypothetical protein